MAKAKSVFYCRECGMESPKWLGQCPGCRAWDCMVEEPVPKGSVKLAGALRKGGTSPIELSSIELDREIRTTTHMEEFDRVLGGGIVKASLVLVGGDPGIGKSTLLLQMCKALTDDNVRVLYISGEESLAQIKLRSDRLNGSSGKMLLLSETNLDMIEQTALDVKPDIMVVDSIQTMYREDIASSPGSVSQVRETTGALLRMAKSLNITIFIVGHVTKEGVVAGPRVLEHMVDTVLYFESTDSSAYRILRAVKNRFGSTNEVGVFEMGETGLREVKNPSEFMLEGTPEGESGSVITASIEGTRPILIEVQALVCKTNFNMPRRTAAGADYNRVNLLMAVIEKRLGVQLSFCDAYVNVAGGMRVNEPSLDLAIVLALLSSYQNKALPQKAIVFGEVGLTGEIRGVSMAENRINEAIRLGMEVCILPRVNVKNLKTDKIRLVGISNVRELLKLF